MVTSEGTAINQKIFNSFLGSLATGGLLLFSLYLIVFLYLFIHSLELYLLNSNYSALFIVTSYFLLSSVMPFAYSFFGIFTTMITYTFFPTQGFGYLLLALAAVFVGGTPYWGGLGTIIGAVFGVGIIAYMEIGIIAIGWSGEWLSLIHI